MVEELAIRAAGEGGMGLVMDTLSDLDLIDAFRHRLRRRGRRQPPPLGIEKNRLRHPGSRQRRQFVGPLQVMVLQGRFVDLGDELVLVGAIGAHRIQMLWTLGERGIKDIGPGIGGRIGIVPQTRQGGNGQHAERQCKEVARHQWPGRRLRMETRRTLPHPGIRGQPVGECAVTPSPPNPKD